MCPASHKSLHERAIEGENGVFPEHSNFPSVWLPPVRPTPPKANSFTGRILFRPITPTHFEKFRY